MQTRSPISIFLERKLGTRKWVVAPRLTKALTERGYDKAISRARYHELLAEYAAARKDAASSRLARAMSSITGTDRPHLVAA